MAVQSAASAANQRLNTLHTGAWPAPPAGEPRYHAATEHCRKLMVASTDHSSGDRPGWTNTKSTGWCPSIFVFFRKWIVWQLPSMVLKWKAPQSLLCHRSRQWQLQQCRSLSTTNTVSLFLPPGFSFLVWFKFSLTLFQFIQRASFSKLFLKFRDKVYCHQMSISNELQPETTICTLYKVSEFLWYLLRP